MRKNKGISLIVLVVTIIVMIIIAGAIIISLNNTNVIDQAENAATSYRLAQFEENLSIERQQKLLAEYGTTEGVNISVRAILDITEENEEEYVVNIETANSIPANMPSGTYYKLDENRYATRTRENERAIILASRGIDRENNLITNTYVVNENLDVYYIISGTIGEKESEEQEWKYAWTSDGVTWSDTYYGDNLPEGTKIEGKIVAKIYETDEIVPSFEVDMYEEPLVLSARKGYILDIQGEGDMPGMIFENENDFGFCAWHKETVRLGTRDGDVVEELVENPVIPYITKVIIGEGITNVPDMMISYLGYNIKEINISNTVTAIGENAFSGCGKLSKIKWGYNIKTIGNSAFYRLCFRKYSNSSECRTYRKTCF